MAISWLQGRLTEMSDEMVEAVFRCTACGACDTTCKFSTDIEVLEGIHALRREVFTTRGEIPVPGLAEAVERVRDTGNVFGQRASARANWARDLDIPSADSKGIKTLLFVGCAYSYNEKLRETIRHTAQVLRRAGVKFGVLGDGELCCGRPVYNSGDWESFDKIASRNIEAFKKAGVRRIVTPCADCFGTFRAIYPKVSDSGVPVVHVSMLIEELIREKKIRLTRPVNRTVTYHDPCNLGRLSEPYVHYNGEMKKVMGQLVIWDPPKKVRRGTHGIYDEPRKVLNAIPGLTLREMDRINEYSWCCGAGGGVKFAYPDFAKWTAQQRLDEAKGTGASSVVTSCPWCEDNLRSAADGMKVESLADLVFEAMGE